MSISKSASLVLDLAKGAAPVEADATQLSQIVVNLITNAADALDGGSGVISVRTGTRHCDRQDLRESYLNDDLTEGHYSYIEVSDTGCGMDLATVARIFEPFFTTKFAGRGLGLAAALGIVRGHRGAIKVRSEPGCGTTFTVLLPAVSGAEPWVPDPASAPVPSAARDQTVLVVDDEEAVRAVAGRMLKRFGFEVVIARDGREALRLFSAAPDRFALVLLDFAMPQMGGEECFSELLKIRPGVRVVISSGYDTEQLIRRFPSPGPASFIQKPYQPRALEQAVRGALYPRHSV